jgi:hypothetical protein
MPKLTERLQKNRENIRRGLAATAVAGAFFGAYPAEAEGVHPKQPIHETAKDRYYDKLADKLTHQLRAGKLMPIAHGHVVAEKHPPTGGVAYPKTKDGAVSEGRSDVYDSIQNAFILDPLKKLTPRSLEGRNITSVHVGVQKIAENGLPEIEYVKLAPNARFQPTEDAQAIVYAGYNLDKVGNLTNEARVSFDGFDHGPFDEPLGKRVVTGNIFEAYGVPYQAID